MISDSIHSFVCVKVYTQIPLTFCYKVDAGIMRHLRHLCFPLKTEKSYASEFLCEIMNA